MPLLVNKMSLQLENLTVTLEGLPILAELNLTVAENSFVTLIAPSGAGKSTLLKVLTGILPPTSGRALINGAAVTGLNTAFSYLPQSDMLFDWLSVYQNVTLYQKINHVAVDKERVAELLELFGLGEYQNFLPSQLSGGMRQRVALLRTMLNPANYLLLDEPFGSLDAITRGKMQDWLLSLPSALKKTTLLVTHDIEEAIYLSDRIVVLSARPAKIIADIAVVPATRNRAWLATTGELKNKIYQLLQN